MGMSSAGIFCFFIHFETVVADLRSKQVCGSSLS